MMKARTAADMVAIILNFFSIDDAHIDGRAVDVLRQTSSRENQ